MNRIAKITNKPKTHRCARLALQKEACMKTFLLNQIAKLAGVRLRKQDLGPQCSICDKTICDETRIYKPSDYDSDRLKFVLHKHCYDSLMKRIKERKR